MTQLAHVLLPVSFTAFLAVIALRIALRSHIEPIREIVVEHSLSLLSPLLAEYATRYLNWEIALIDDDGTVQASELETGHFLPIFEQLSALQSARTLISELVTALTFILGFSTLLQLIAVLIVQYAESNDVWRTAWMSMISVTLASSVYFAVRIWSTWQKINDIGDEHEQSV